MKFNYPEQIEEMNEFINSLASSESTFFPDGTVEVLEIKLTDIDNEKSQ